MDFVGSALLANTSVARTSSQEITNTFLGFLAKWSIIAILTTLVVYYSSRKISTKSVAKQDRNAKTVRFKEELYGTQSEAVKAQLQGTWHLVSYHLELNTPITIAKSPFGKEPRGRLIYTSDGYMSVNVMQPGCELFKASNPHGGTIQENSSAAAHYMAYSGRYETYEHEGQKLVNHVLDTSLWPNWLTSDQMRICEIDGDELVLRPANMPTFLGMKVAGILRWKRASSLG